MSRAKRIAARAFIGLIAATLVGVAPAISCTGDVSQKYSLSRGSAKAAPYDPAAVNEVPVTGDAVPGLESYDRIIREIMQKWSIPGAAVAVAKDGRLVYARGFGYADVAAGELVSPDSMFRIASVSKPLTAITVMKLVEQGEIDLDAKAFDYLADLEPPPGSEVDPRLASITVRNLLEHSVVGIAHGALIPCSFPIA
jgi:N-acyl-D-amino-acid deacylase